VAAPRLTWRQAIGWRTRAQHLDERVPRPRAVDVAAELCGVHAQVMSSAELTLWARVDGLEPDAVQRSLWEERDLLKTWAMRGTLHLLAARDYPLWQAALSTYDHFWRPPWLKALGVTTEQLEEILDDVAKALDGQVLTREQIADAVAREGDEELAERLRSGWGSFLKPVSFRGRLCFAPSEGRYVRFTDPHRWLGEYEEVDPEVAIAEMTRRYLAAYGPATQEDYARWWRGHSPAQARKRMQALGDEAVEVDLEGLRAWLPSSALDDALEAEPPRNVRLLPAFDQWVVGSSREAEAMIEKQFRPRVFRKAAWFSPVVLVRGKIEGVWWWERKGRRLLVRLEPFGKLPNWARAEAEREAARLPDFLGGELELSWS
jgi:DNA glycosylase AlkZ-like